MQKINKITQTFPGIYEIRGSKPEAEEKQRLETEHALSLRETEDDSPLLDMP